jgi:hypothetical protein
MRVSQSKIPDNQGLEQQNFLFKKRVHFIPATYPPPKRNARGPVLERLQQNGIFSTHSLPLLSALSLVLKAILICLPAPCAQIL